MSNDKCKLRFIVEFLIVIVLSVAFIIVGNRYCSFDRGDGADAIAESAKVIKITDIRTEYIEGVENTVIVFQGEMLTGEYKGEILTMEQDINEMTLDKSDPVEEGDRVLVSHDDFADASAEGTSESEWYYFQQDRIPGLICLAALFLLALIIIGRMKGLTTIVSLGFTGAVVFCVYVPAILSGKNIYAATIIITVFIVFASLTLLNGINKKTLCAIIGNIGGIVLTAVLAFVVNVALKVTGVVDESSVYLASVGSTFTIDLKAIVWSSIIIGSLGAIMDVSMSIASAMQELAVEMKDRSFKRMVASGMNIGRDAIGTMTITLVLAYAGSSIAPILLFVANNRSLTILMNLEMVVVEIIQAIVGSMGILLAVPITVAFAAWVFNRESLNSNSIDFHSRM